MAGLSEHQCAQDQQWGSEAIPREVTIWHLEMLDAAEAQVPEALADDVRITRAQFPTAELVRWLYSVVGGPYRWYERLGWSKEEWEEELAAEGSEIWLLFLGDTPAGYCQLSVDLRTGSSSKLQAETEILYFGLMQWAQGRGLGRVFLQTLIQRAWDIDQRHALPPVGRVWVHTCDLDGEFALANYQARGLKISAVDTESEVVLKQPLGSWSAMFAQG